MSVLRGGLHRGLGFISCQKVDDSLRPPWLPICFSPLYSFPCITKELKHAAKCLLIIQQYINSSTDQTSPIYRENRDVFYLFKVKMSKTEFIKKKKEKNTLFRLDQQSLLHFPYSTEANELARNCVLRENYGFWVSGSLSCRAYARGTVSPSLRQKLQLRFEAALVLPYTLTDSQKNTVTPHTGCAMNINGCSSFGLTLQNRQWKMFMHDYVPPGPLHISSLMG